jgi:hypothetical protein
MQSSRDIPTVDKCAYLGRVDHVHLQQIATYQLGVHVVYLNLEMNLIYTFQQEWEQVHLREFASQVRQKLVW